jgi:membrane protein implicated in regulation of membrane protease activity
MEILLGAVLLILAVDAIFIGIADLLPASHTVIVGVTLIISGVILLVGLVATAIKGYRKPKD